MHSEIKSRNFRDTKQLFTYLLYPINLPIPRFKEYVRVLFTILRGWNV